MITRLLPLLSLAAFSVASAGTVQLVVPSYEYPLGKGHATYGAGIANDNTVVGEYIFRGVEAGYAHSLAAGYSQPIIFPGADTTAANGVNTSGLVCGTFFMAGRKAANHGFFFDGATYTQFDVPGSINTYVTGINDAGDFCGYADEGNGLITGFVSTGGVLTTFTVGTSDTFPQAINNLGQVAGYYTGLDSGFFRDADGTITSSINYPAATDTHIYGLNDQGIMVGDYTDIGNHIFGLVVQNLTQFTSYDYPDTGDYFTVFRGINNSNLISGFDQNFYGEGTHSFIARFRR